MYAINDAEARDLCVVRYSILEMKVAQTSSVASPHDRGTATKSEHATAHRMRLAKVNRSWTSNLGAGSQTGAAARAGRRLDEYYTRVIMHPRTR